MRRNNKRALLRTFDWWAGSVSAGVTPIQQAYSLQVTNRTETTEKITWLNPIVVPDGYIILAKSGSAVNSYPVDGTTYAPNAAFASGSQLGTGNYVVGNVDSAATLELTITALTAGTTYHYRVMAYNGSGAGIKYRTFDEKGHSWQSQTAPPAGMIGTCKSADESVYMRTGGGDIYYSLNQGTSWTLWANIPGGQFHSCECCEGGTILNASNNPVSRKFLVNDHSGTGKIYGMYTPGDTPETVTTSPTAETWNEGSWNPAISQYCAIADSGGGGSRIVLLTNAKTAAYDTTLGTNSWASVCATPNAVDGTKFIACAKNPASSGFAFMKLVGSTWSIKASPVGKNYHMIQYMPEFGANGRVGATSADGTSADAIYSDDFFETFTVSNLDGSTHASSSYGAFYYDPITRRSVAVSRTPNKVYAITTDFITWEYIPDISTTAVWFNVMAIGDGFSIQASSGTPLGAHTVPSNIANAKTYPSFYQDWLNELVVEALPAPSAPVQVKGRKFIADIDAIASTFWANKIERLYIMRQDGGANTFKIDLKNPTSEAAELIEVGSNTFTSGVGWAGNGTAGYLRSQFIPSTDWAAANSCGIIWVIGSDQKATVFDFGATGSAGATQRVLINTHATDDTVASVALNSSSVASNANTTSVEFWAMIRDSVSLILHRGASVFDSSLGALTTRPDREIYIGAHNSNGTAASFTTRQFQLFIILKADITEAQKNSIRTAWLDYIA